MKQKTLRILSSILIGFLLFLQQRYRALADEKENVYPNEVRAIYLSLDYVFNEKKIRTLEKIILESRANAIVIDVKDGQRLSKDEMASLVKRFKRYGVYTIARIVVLQDSYFARMHPETAIKTSSGDFWYSGRRVWKRYWLDGSSRAVQDYNIEIAKQAIDAGFDEIQFDYFRFPTDGNMSDINYPEFNPGVNSKTVVMTNFAKRLHDELKSYKSTIVLSVDVFGEVLLYGRERGIGQDLKSLAMYFDVIAPMAYPSHYMCGEFGVHDPTANPYKVYFDTLSRGLRYLQDQKVIFRPWIQDFSIPSIYDCGPFVSYDQEKVMTQIEAARKLGINGFMLWNASNNFTVGALR